MTGLGCVRLLEAVREAELPCRFYQASSSELYGKVAETPQTERTPFRPRSPYACAKAYAFYVTVNYRESYGLHACNGILFNHESPRRGETFVTRKITRAASRIKYGIQDKLFLGNLDAKRDWGFAGDYVEGMRQMLQSDEPDDYILATGETHSVREFLDEAFGALDLDWKKHAADFGGEVKHQVVPGLFEEPSRWRRVCEVVLSRPGRRYFADAALLQLGNDVAAQEALPSRYEHSHCAEISDHGRFLR